MKEDLARQIEGYAEVAREQTLAARRGDDHRHAMTLAAAYLEGLHPTRLHLRVARIRVETPSTTTFRLVADRGALPPFQAGQYLAVAVEAGGIRTSRPYSIASPPRRTDHYDLTVKRVPGGLVSNHLLDRLREGDRLETSGPWGNFVHNPLLHGQDLVFIAGGSGITPFMSMLAEIAARGLDRRVTLIYGNAVSHDIIFHEALTALADDQPWLTYVPVVERPAADYRGACGLMTAERIRQAVGTVDGKTFYLCGPEGMYTFCGPALASLGVPRRRIRREVFGPPADVTRLPGWPDGVRRAQSFTVQIRGGPQISAAAGEPLLNALERHGLAVPSQCRAGECSLCRVRLLAGKVFEPPGALVRRSDREFGYLHACLAYPIEDLEIII